MDRILSAQNDAVTAYKSTKGNLSMVSFGRCGEAYKRAFMRKWNKIDAFYKQFKFLRRCDETSNSI